MDMPKNGDYILPYWSLYYEEVSNNVYHVDLIDSYGREASTTYHDLEKAIATCEEYAFEIEKQISKSWGRFLYEYALLKLPENSSSEHKYHHEAFGSWYIVCDEKRLIHDGKNDLLITQDKKSDWIEHNSKSAKEITFRYYLEQIDYLKTKLTL